MSGGKWPDYVLDPPGLVGDVVKWIRENSGMRQPKFALAAGLTVCGALVGRAVKDWTGQRTNIYTLAVGNTSAGKNAPICAIERIVSAVGQHKLIVGEACSASAVEALLDLFPVRLFLLDEVGHYLSTMRTAGRSDVNLRSVIPALMKCWSCAGGVFCGKVRTKGQDAGGKGEVYRNVREPCVCLYGTTTPDILFDGMASSDFADGSMPRFLAFMSFDRPTFKAKAEADVPGPLVDRLRGALDAIGVKRHAKKGATVAVDDVPTARAVKCDRVAEAVFGDFSQFTHDRMCEADRGGEKSLQLWGKAVEISRRVALTVAAFRNPRAPVVESQDADYFVELVRLAVGELVEYASRHVADTRAERVKKLIVEAIRSAGGVQTKSLLTRSTRKLTRRERDEAIEDLIEGGVVKMSTERGKGRKAETVYRV